MRMFASLVGTVALSMFLGANGAEAAKCEGTSARKSEPPITLHKGDDGSLLMFIQSTGINTPKAAAAGPLEPTWQTCVGFWAMNADKSGSGAGHCYMVDADGDRWSISWEGVNAGGTWQTVGGTGKYAKNVGDKGTWAPGKMLADGIRLGTWEGECAE